MSSSIFEAYIPLAQELRKRQDGDWLVSFALKYFFTRHRIERVQDLHKAEHKREEHEKRHDDVGRHDGRGRERRRDGEGRGGERRARGRDDRHGARHAEERHGERHAEERHGERHAEERHGERHAEERHGEGEPRRGRERAPEPAEPQAAAQTPGNGDATAGESAPRTPRSRIFLSLGEQDGADDAKIREAIGALAPGVEPRAVDVRRTHAFVDVAPEALDAAVAALNGKEWNGKPLTAEKARRRRR